ncbi:MAG: HAD family hydrolase [Candidatus Sericytochromatia bacterium]|nr:HAD family hydrolase [Candidatus Sericytochromatia bacterium]
MRPAVFLDRDGTVNIEAGYIHELENLNLIPGAAEAIRALNQQHIPVVLVTNQSGPARGYYPESWVHQLHERLVNLLTAEGAHLDKIYYCPHLPDGSVAEYSGPCECRKPEPGMLLAAARDLDLDLGKSFMIGDKATDVEVGQRVGAHTILLTSGYGQQVLDGTYQHPVKPDYICDSLQEAWQNIMRAYFNQLSA